MLKSTLQVILEAVSSELEETIKDKEAAIAKVRQEAARELESKFEEVKTYLNKIGMETNPKLQEFCKATDDQIVKAGMKDSGLWNVLTCASEAHLKTVNELEAERIENNKLKEQLNGYFSKESNRVAGHKRAAEEEPPRSDKIESGMMWNEISSMIDNEMRGFR